jgi:hypothetical protein
MLWFLLAGTVMVAGIEPVPCPARHADSATVMPSPRLADSHGLGENAGWRHLWADSLCLPVLDAEKFAGGLTAYVAESGPLAHVVIARSGDGTAFRLLPLDRDPVTNTLPPELLGTPVDRFLRDLGVTVHPTAPLVAATLYREVGLDAIEPDLVVLRAPPDSAHLLDSLRDKPVWLERAPAEDGKTYDRFARVLTTAALLDQARRDPRTRIAVERFLAARLLDVVMGDRDRGSSHWVWGLDSTGVGKPQWVPIASRQEQTFLRAKGWSARILNQYEPGHHNFGPEVSDLRGLVDRGYDLDRLLLTRLDRPKWDSVALALQTALTVSRIDSAASRLPASQLGLSWSVIVEGLLRRRALLPRIADEYFRLINRNPDVELSDAAERVTIQRSESGDLELRAEVDDTLTLRRTFRRTETREVRVYLERGRDSVFLDGVSRGGTGLRIASRDGAIALTRADDDARNVVLYADRDSARMQPRDAVQLVPRPQGRRIRWERDGEAPLAPDWGMTTSPAVKLGYDGDLGFVVGGGFRREWRGFGQPRYRQQLRAAGAFASRPSGFRLQLAFERRDLLRNLHLLAAARVTGIDVIRYFGFGNGTGITESRDFYRVEADELAFEVAAEWSSRPELVFTIGPFISLGNTDTAGTATLVALDQPYGSGRFQYTGLHSRLEFAGLRSLRDGLRLRTRLEAVAVPGWMDVDRGGFTRVAGEGRLLWGFGSTRRLVLATRLGGTVLTGIVPFRLAARIGGPLTLRGYDTDRFSGDGAAAYGAIEARIRAFRFHINFISSDLGVLGFVDAGRVWQEGEASSAFHTGYGGGLWAAPSVGWLPGIDEVVARLDVAHSSERTIVSIGTGFRF